MENYYSNKIELIKDIFGAKKVTVSDGEINIDNQVYPILDDVIILLKPNLWPSIVRSRLGKYMVENSVNDSNIFSKDIQDTFGSEWTAYPEILPDYNEIFNGYFDIVPEEFIEGARIFDLGCGTGRWSFFLKDRAKELVMVDFSEAIFVARNNLKKASNAIFFLGDVTALPFRENSADLIISLGVLHHLPVNALEVTRNLSKFAPKVLIYLYYIFDNRPSYYKLIFIFVDYLRRFLSGFKGKIFRTLFTWFGAIFLYYPPIYLGHLLKPFGLSSHIPLYQGYGKRSFSFIRQDVYDRFFTSIEQRFKRDEILELTDTYSKITVSKGIPYWHFLCEK